MEHVGSLKPGVKGATLGSKDSNHQIGPICARHGAEPSSSMENTTSAGWWLTYPSEKYDFVTWDDEIFPI